MLSTSPPGHIFAVMHGGRANSIPGFKIVRVSANLVKINLDRLILRIGPVE